MAALSRPTGRGLAGPSGSRRQTLRPPRLPHRERSSHLAGRAASPWSDWLGAPISKTSRLRSETKEALLELCTGTHPRQRALQVEETLQALSDLNPTQRPAFAKRKLQGAWQLIWSSQSASPWMSPARVAGAYVMQRVETTTGRVDNIVRWPGPNITIRGGAAVKACAESNASRTLLKIDRFELELGPWTLGASPWDAPRLTVKGGAGDRSRALNEPSGWLDTVYLDDDLRVSLSNVGDYYVHRKLTQEQEDALERGLVVHA